MKVFKFGGASVKDADGVRNVLKVLEKTGDGNKLLVVSAMGKTTNALEEVVADYLAEEKIPQNLEKVKDYHLEIAEQLFGKPPAPVFEKLAVLFDELGNFLLHNKSTRYDYVYDQIVGYGELISTTIVREYLEFCGKDCVLLDAREHIKTDSIYRDAGVNWQETLETFKDKNFSKLSITQGFIGSDADNFTTTLGREGSDYTAAIFAYCLDAQSVSIWKDVPGVLNSDPRHFKNARLLNHISYEEAIELAFYGASVIHPKTLQPLQRKSIPLFVKPFNHPGAPGTAVGPGQKIEPLIPCFIVKKNQVLLSLSSLDFSFLVEESISEIFKLFHQYRMKVDLIQNSAISFSVCLDNRFNQLEKLVQHLKARYSVEFTTGVSLYTIRHFTEAAINFVEKEKEVLLKQLSRDTVQIVTRT